MPRPYKVSSLSPGLRHRRHYCRSRCSAFSLLEVLVVVGIIAVLVGILIPVVGRARAASRNTTCLANLRSLGLGFRLFAERNQGRLPDPSQTQTSWETALTPFVHPNVFACPSDNELFPTLGSSFDWRDTGDPTTGLAGKDITSVGRSDLLLVFEALPSWHTRHKINAYSLDGSALTWDEEAAFTDLSKDNSLP